MKLSIVTLLFLSGVMSETIEDSKSSIIMPTKTQKYRTSDVFSKNMDKDGTFSFYPFLNEFVSYSGWYRKPDSRKSEEENLKDQIKTLKTKLFGEKNVSMKSLVENKEVHNQNWLNKQLKIARILELEDLLEKSN